MRCDRLNITKLQYALMRILITGATGFIGRGLIRHLLGEKNNQIIALTRKNTLQPKGVKWISSIDEISARDTIDAIINLGGAPISKRWTKRYKLELINSRLNSLDQIFQIVDKLETKPNLLISASAVGYYGNQGASWLSEEAMPHLSSKSSLKQIFSRKVTSSNKIMLEEEAMPHLSSKSSLKQNFSRKVRSSNKIKQRDDFTHELCKRWEAAALEAQKYGLRVCIARLGVVLGASGGIIARLLPLFKLGLGGKIGKGDQYISWIHLNDVISAFQHFINQPKSSGIYNLVSPKPITSIEFTKAFSTQLKKPAIFNVPAIGIKLIYGEMGQSLLLNSQRVSPSKLLAEGFKFEHFSIQSALNEIIK